MELRKKIYELIHKKPYGTEDVIQIKDIEIPKRFKVRHPKQWKMDRALEFYKKHGYVDKPISVAKVIKENRGQVRYLLVDEYTRYLTIMNQGNKSIPVKYIDILF